jgi:DNA-binding response OmpR family regulator
MQHEKHGNLRRARILAVDDDARVLAGLRAQLAPIDCNCKTCCNASEAMLQFATDDFDLVITDLSMPSIDGLSIIGMIRSQSNVPILVLTGHTVEYAPQLSGYGNVRTLRKPVDSEIFVSYVRSMLSGKYKSEVPARG